MRDQLTLVTWNLWFGEHERPRRLAAALEVVRAQDPDVVAFQELVPETLRALQEVPWIREGYRVSDPMGRTMERYGTALLTRLEPARFRVLPLPSAMGRKLVSVDVELGDHLLRVGGMHLESLRAVAARRLQLQRIFPYLDEADAAVLMGDMNFDAGAGEEAEVPGGYADLWPSLHPGERGVTRCTESNAMAAVYASHPKSTRIDRVFLRGGAPGWRATAIERIGTAPVAGTRALFPSDHFGLVARLRR